MNFIKHHARKLIGTTFLVAGLVTLTSCGGGGGSSSGGGASMQITPVPLPAAVAEIQPTTAPADGRVQGDIQDGQGIVYDIGNFDMGQRGELVDMSTEVDIIARVYHQDGGEIQTQPLPYSDRRGRMFIAPRDGVYYAHISAEEDGDRVPVPTQSGRAVASSDFAIRQVSRRYICVFTRFEDATSTEPLDLARPSDAYPDLRVRNSGALLGRASQGATGWESPITVVAGNPFSVQLLVLNHGSPRSPSVTLTYLRSADATITHTDAAASQDNTVTVPRLRQVDTSGDEINYFDRSILTLNAPTSATYPQTYYYGGCVTRHFAESDRTNNCSPAVTVRVTAPPRLSNLALSGGATLSPSFAHNIAAYTADVASTVAQTTVSATAAGSGRVTTIMPDDADSATDGHQVNLAVGANRVRVTVTGTGEVTRTYTVTINRAPPALSALALSGVTLSPTFARDTIAYTAEVANTVTQTTVTATPVAGSVTIMPVDAASGTSGHQVDLAVGANEVSVTVTAGGEMRTYTVTVNRAPPALSALALSGVTLSPAFDSDTTAYTVEVANTVMQTTVTATPVSGSVAIMPADDDDAVNGHQVDLAVGANPIRVTVTAGGEMRTYTVTVNRLSDTPTVSPGGPGDGPGAGPGAGTGGGSLVAENLLVTPTRFAPGGSVTASVTVRNSGFEASGSASLEFLALVGENSGTLRSVPIASLAAGATRNYRETFTVSRSQAPAGANAFSVLACIGLGPCEMVEVRFQ